WPLRRRTCAPTWPNSVCTAAKRRWEVPLMKVLLDTDPGIDDSLAIMLALRSPELEVVGLTTASGNVPADQGASNAARILEYLGREEIPLYKGEDKPRVVELVTAQDTLGQDGLGETYLPEPKLGYKEG